MTTKQIIKDIEELMRFTKEDIESGSITEMDLTELDNFKTQEEKNAYIKGIELVVDTILDLIKGGVK